MTLSLSHHLLLRTLRRGTLAAGVLAWGCTNDAPASNAGFVPVLAYEAIASGDEDRVGDARAVQRQQLDEQMQFLALNGYSTATVGELAEYMTGDRVLPPRTVVLTFDDAWDDAEAVASILDRHGLEGTFFLGVDASTKRELSTLDWAPLEAIADNPSFEFGGQPGSLEEGADLVSWLEGETPGKGPLDVVWQVEVTRQFLEAGLGRPVYAYAWPEGRVSDELVALARKAGYTALLTRRQTTNHAGGDPLSIGRYPVLGTFGLTEFQRLLNGPR
jgi:hypothetical protein